MDRVLQKIQKYKVVPVVTIKEIEGAEELFGALVGGGLPLAEVCFRTDCAEEAIRLAAEKYPEMLVGAGTVINGKQCENAVKAGAQFIVSPGLSEEVAAVCRECKLAYFPGVVTPADIMRALSLGLTCLKFFPAVDFGGLKTIKALSAAFPQVKFMPTGGVNLENLTEFLSFPKIFACGGSWMIKGDIMENCRKICEKLYRDPYTG